MRAPAFWWQPSPSALAWLLSPASLLWGTLAGARMRRPGTDADAPVVCIGNFTAGGAGKTPVAIACASILLRNGFSPAFLSRGYGGSFTRDGTAHRIDPHNHSAAQAGDEPLLLARVAPTFVAADRVKGANAATAMGANVLVMDDGLQNPGLNKSMSIAVVDGPTGVGNGMCLPAGPLRAPLNVQMPLVDALIMVGRGEAGDTVAKRAADYGKPVFHATLEPDADALARLRGKKAIAFAGIGRPGKFFDTLQEAGIEIADAFAFADHQTLDAGEIALLQKTARDRDAILVTTEKDFARVGEAFGSKPPEVLPVTLEIEDRARLGALMVRKIRPR